MTLVELMFSVTIGLLVCVAVLATLWFSMRSFQAMMNYQKLNTQGRLALDIMSADIRQANGCSTNATFSSSSLTLSGTNVVNSLPCTINYNYDSAATTLTRTYSDTSTNGSQVKVLLTNLTYFNLSYFQRNPIANSFNVFTNDSGNPAVCKAVQVDWSCSLNVLGTIFNTLNGESAMIIIRKE